MKDKLILLFFWTTIPIVTIIDAHLAIKDQSIYFALLSLFNCNIMAGMIVTLEDYARIMKQIKNNP